MRFLLPAITILVLGALPVKGKPHEYDNLIDDPKLASVKTRLTQGIPANPTPLAILPKDSPHHRANQGKK